MTAQEVIATIPAEIERMKGYYRITNPYDKRAIRVCENILSSISDLEKSEKPTPAEGLEEEIARTYYDGSVADTSDIDHVTYENIAEHFAEWGYLRAAEKYDEIEYNRQREEESEKPMNQENSHEAEVNAALRKIDEELIKQLSEKPNQDEFEEEIQVERKKLMDVFGPMNGEQVLAIKDLARHFAQWGAENLKK